MTIEIHISFFFLLLALNVHNDLFCRQDTYTHRETQNKETNTKMK